MASEQSVCKGDEEEGETRNSHKLAFDGLHGPYETLDAVLQPGPPSLAPLRRRETPPSAHEAAHGSHRPLDDAGLPQM